MPEGMLKAEEEFLLTHPVWDVTLCPRCLSCASGFLLTHPVWDVTKRYQKKGCMAEISTHTSRVGCDLAGLILSSPDELFLLTHPVWDVTDSKGWMRWIG